MPDPTVPVPRRPRPMSFTVVVQGLAGATVAAESLSADGLTTLRIGAPDARVELLDDIDHVHRVLAEAIAQVEAIQAGR
jgi:hypothetical protein